MMGLDLRTDFLIILREALGDRLREDVSLARYTAARIGGPAQALIEIHSKLELIETVNLAWRHGIPFILLGGGSNVLISDEGLRCLIIINRSKGIRFDEHEIPPQVWAESGVNIGVLARQAAQRGSGGLEWAAGIPGTLGGAIAGNAGAHGSDMAGNLYLAEILHLKNAGEPPVLEQWSVEELEYTYRNSVIKRKKEGYVILTATLNLVPSTPQEVRARLDENIIFRRRTQPPGASMGSMFKNPPGDFAGRLIEAAGLKGARIGDALISTLHANFFINLGHATADDVFGLIKLAQNEVAGKFGQELELEIELLGDFAC